MTEMKRAPLERDHPYDSGQELKAAFAQEMEQGITHQNIYVSLPPSARTALMVESKISGVYRTEAVREAIVEWIADRIDQRKGIRE